MSADHVSLVDECPLFEGLSSEEIDAAVGQPDIEVVAQGESVFGEGDASRCAYVVLEGEVGIRSHILDEGESSVPFRPVLVKLKRGQVFGEFALLDARPRSAEVFVIATAKFLVLDSDWLDAVSERNPGLAYRILRNLTRTVVDRVRDTNRKLCGALEWGWKARGLDRR